MTKERTGERSIGPEPESDDVYDRFLRQSLEDRQRLDRPYVIKSEDRPWEVGRHAKVKFYLAPLMDDPVIPDVNLFTQEIPERNGRHTHQGGVAILGLEGQGETYADGDRLPWKAGDLITLPITPGGGVEHQHFNRNDPDNPAKWLAIQYWPFRRVVGNERIQNETAPWVEDDDHDHIDDSAPSHDGFILKELDYDYWTDYEPPTSPETLYDDLFIRRNLQRRELSRVRNSDSWVKIAGDDIEWEWNPQGKMKWYMHPSYEERCMWTLLYAVQEIPPGSRSGKQLRQGFVVHYILEGEGYSIINGNRYEWKKDDTLAIPVRLEGNTVQHFNSDPENEAKFVIAEPYVQEAVGYDMGSGLEQLETCPEYTDNLDEEIYGRPERLT